MNKKHLVMRVSDNCLHAKLSTNLSILTIMSLDPREKNNKQTLEAILEGR